MGNNYKAFDYFIQFIEVEDTMKSYMRIENSPKCKGEYILIEVKYTVLIRLACKH